MAVTDQRAGLQRLRGSGVNSLQAYHVDVPSAANAKDISVVSYSAREGMASPYEIGIEFTHRELLSRADYLGRDGHFTISAEDSTEPRVYRGIVVQFKRIKKTKDFFSYPIVIASQMARLGLLHRCRVFQHQSGPQIIESILLRDKFMDHQFVFKLRREYPIHDFRLQYQMSDLDYIHLICEQEGLFWYSEQGKHGDVIVFGDDIDHYVYTPELKVPYRQSAGLEAGIEAVFALETHAELVPQSVMVSEYNPLIAWERFKDEFNVAIADTTTYGTPYIYVQLNPLLAGTPPPGTTEAGSSLLLVPASLATQYQIPRVADLHRPVHGSLDQPSDALSNASRWAGVEPAKIANSLQSGLDAAATGALREAEMKLSLTARTTNLDQTVGHAGIAAPWLALSCAASLQTDETEEQIVILGHENEVHCAVMKRPTGDTTQRDRRTVPAASGHATPILS
jgi:hypothetical protein